MVLAVYGIGISRGVAIGKAHVAHRNRLEISEYHIAEERVEQEVRRFHDAVSAARQSLQQVHDRIAATTPTEIREFIDAHELGQIIGGNALALYWPGSTDQASNSFERASS